MKALIACEFTGTVREEFDKIGFDAWSCDLLPSEKGGKHYQCDVLEVLDLGWDIMVGHPPCTDLSVSGAKWFKNKVYEQPMSIRFFNRLWEANIPRIALENPVSVIASYIGKCTQSVQPWQFGHGEVKRTCLWLKNLPPLVPTFFHKGREAKVHNMAPSATRGLDRSRFPQGIAEAMAKQWGMRMLAGVL